MVFLVVDIQYRLRSLYFTLHREIRFVSMLWIYCIVRNRLITAAFPDECFVWFLPTRCTAHLYSPAKYAAVLFFVLHVMWIDSFAFRVVVLDPIVISRRNFPWKTLRLVCCIVNKSFTVIVRVTFDSNSFHSAEGLFKKGFADLLHSYCLG